MVGGGGGESLNYFIAAKLHSGSLNEYTETIDELYFNI